jgi:hypothetical protein
LTAFNTGKGPQAENTLSRISGKIRRSLMTVKEALRDAKTLVRKKMRQANAANQKAYKKAYNLKEVKNGNTRRRSKGSKSSAAAIDGGVAQVGRDSGVPGAGGEAAIDS